MLASRVLIVAFVVALVLLATTPSASATGEVTTTHETVRETVEWTLPAGQCPSLPVGVSVSGTGQRHAVIATHTRADGTTTVINNDLVMGTAVDSTGQTYRFVYQNHATEMRPPGGSGLPVQIHMTDTFVLRSASGGVALDVGFNWRWTYTPPALYWPPVDNWERLSTRGDPLACDPI